MSKLVAVTGGTGFIGRHLVGLLLEQDNSVRVLTRRLDLAQDLWGNQVELWNGDLTIPETLSGFTNDASVVFNLAGTISDELQYAPVNVTGTENLLKECVQKPLERLIHLSSVGVIGPTGQGIVDEGTACNPSDGYERSKLSGELLAMGYWRDFGVPTAILRPTIVFGGGRKRPYDDSFAAWMQSIQSGRFRFIGDGEYVANYVYVEDVAAACIHLAKHDEAIGQSYIMSDSCSLREFVVTAADIMKAPVPSTVPLWMAQTIAMASGLLEQVTKRPLPLTESRVKALTNVVRYSSDKLRHELGFIPAYGYREGLNRTIRWYKTEGILGS